MDPSTSSLSLYPLPRRTPWTPLPHHYLFIHSPGEHHGPLYLITISLSTPQENTMDPSTSSLSLYPLPRRTPWTPLPHHYLFIHSQGEHHGPLYLITIPLSTPQENIMDPSTSSLSLYPLPRRTPWTPLPHHYPFIHSPGEHHGPLYLITISLSTPKENTMDPSTSSLSLYPLPRRTPWTPLPHHYLFIHSQGEHHGPLYLITIPLSTPQENTMDPSTSSLSLYPLPRRTPCVEWTPLNVVYINSSSTCT